MDKNKEEQKCLPAFGALKPRSTRFRIPGPSYAKKIFYKEGTAYAREEKSGDWVCMLSCDGVEIVK